MEIDVKQSKQRNKRRERAQRMIAERDKDAAAVDGAAGGVGGPTPLLSVSATGGGVGGTGGGTGGLSSPTDDSADEDMPVCREKPPRPQHVRRKRKEKDMSPVLEEDIVDGFAILAFKTYEDLEYAIKLANKRNEKRLSSIVELTSIMVDDKPPKIIDTTAQKMDQQKANSERLAAEAAAWSLNNNNNNNGTANGSSNGSSTAATATVTTPAAATATSNGSGSSAPSPATVTAAVAVAANGSSSGSSSSIISNSVNSISGSSVGSGGASGSSSAASALVAVGSSNSNGSSSSSLSALSSGTSSSSSSSSSSSGLGSSISSNGSSSGSSANLSLPPNVDPGTSDDSGRASERLTTSSVAQRDPDSSRDRLSDASSRCSSGKGYICDSEGDDDKGSDGGSVVFAATPQSQSAAAAQSQQGPAASAGAAVPSPAAPRKSDFPPTGLPLSNGPLAGLAGSASPVAGPPGASAAGPAPPAPSPAPAALPPPSLPPPYPTTPMQVSNGPIGTHLTPIGAHPGAAASVASPQSQQPVASPQQPQPPASPKTAAGLGGKPSLLPTASAKIPVTAAPTTTAPTPPGSQKQQGSAPQSPMQQAVPSPAGQQPHTPQSQPPPSPQQLGPPGSQHNSNSNSSSSNAAATAAGGPVKPSSVPSFIGAGSSFAPSAASSSLPNGLPPASLSNTGGQPPHSNSSSNSAAPSSLPLNVPHTPPAATPASGQSPAIHPSVESSLAASASMLRTHSPAVATSAALSAAVMPTGLLNGSHHHPGIPHTAAMMMPNGLGSLPPHYRTGYPGYPPLYAPYGSFQHNPYLQPSPQLSPRMHPGAPLGHGGLPPSMMGLGLMDSRLQQSMVHGNGSPSHMVPRDRDASPMAQPPQKSTVRPITPNTNSNGSSSNPPQPSSRDPGPPPPHPGAAHQLHQPPQPPPPLSHQQQQGPPGPGPAPHLVGPPPSSHHPTLGPGSHHLPPHHPPTSSSSSSNSNNSSHPPPHSSSAAASSARSAHSPRGHSPNRERDSYSSNVSSLSRSTPGSALPYGSGGSSTSSASTGGPPPGPSPTLPYGSSPAAGPPALSGSPTVSSAPISSSLTYPKPTLSTTTSGSGSTGVPPGWPPALPPTSLPSSAPPSHSPAAAAASNSASSHSRPTPPSPSASSVPGGPPVSVGAPPSSFPAPLFAAPMPPPVVSTAGSTPTQPSPAPLPFSAESLFSTKVSDQADMLRRELDNRFLDRSGLSSVPTSPYLRQELHHHQHQHTHLHQHQHQHQHQPILPTAPAPTSALFPPPLFKDVPKIGAGDSPFYRTGLGMPAYPAYGPGLLHPGLSGPTQFVPPSHLQSFVPKKTGKWNAMHVRIAWEIYHHQAKQNPDKAASMKTASDMLRPPSHMYPPSSGGLVRPHDLPSSAYPPTGMPGRPGNPYESAPLPPSFMGSAASHLGVSPFGRYASPYGGSPFGGMSPFSREMQMGSQLPGALHDPWRRTLSSAIPRSVGSYAPQPPPGAAGPWPPTIKQDPAIAAETARREAEERERQREREERERERQRREREERDKQREREREEKLRKEQQEREREREQRERERERERKEKERREMERREMERERMLQQQQRESKAAAAAASANSMVGRDRSPLRNGSDLDIRIKEERKEGEEMMMRNMGAAAAAAAAAGDPRYHPGMMPHPYMTGRHPAHMLPGAQFSRSMLPPTMGLPPHFPPSGPWGPDPFRDYRLESLHQLRYNPLMDVYRAEEAKASLLYAAQSAAHYRSKEPSPVPPPPQSHHRMPPGAPGGPGGPPGPPPGSLKPPSSHLGGPGGGPSNGPAPGGGPPGGPVPPGMPGGPMPVSVDMHKKEDSCQSR
ncbi:proline-rich protein 36 isoform X6 [Culex pipiens pallens]|uniref:proline-rich protein 36 isoform X6 n=1 Tax=Culex pipiens pallens TaxID=42434 RepID=UPI0022AAA4EB|nr:proline-rich protein 36 isoform X6 [Culex pipiens pallens]